MYFCSMENQENIPGTPPPDCFRLEEIEAFQAAEGQVLSDVNYYLWLNTAEPGEAPYRFLFYLELVFEDSSSLLVTSGDDSEAIRVSTAEALIETAARLRTLHNKVSIQRVNAGSLPIWQPAAGRTLEAVRLSRNDRQLYQNDAFLLDFGAHGVLVHLAEKEGLAVSRWQ